MDVEGNGTYHFIVRPEGLRNTINNFLQVIRCQEQEMNSQSPKLGTGFQNISMSRQIIQQSWDNLYLFIN